VHTSSYDEVRKYQSPIRVVAAFLFRSRETKIQTIEKLTAQLAERDEQIANLQRQERKLQHRTATALHCIGELVEQLATARQSVNLPDDPSLATHGYGARMIALAVNVAQSVGFRGAERVLDLFFDWLGVATNTPTRNAICGWMQRLGLDQIQQPWEPGGDWVMMVDHSIQTSKEKVLAVLGVPVSSLPEPGETLKHKDVRVLEVKPGTEWKIEDMAKEYQALEKRYGTPRAVLVDGAVELRDGAKCLQTEGKDTIVLRDLKHYAANVLKSVVGKEPRFQEVIGQMGSTRSAIQQTELAHLTPPKLKSKSRFMNLAATVHWMTLIVWLLRNPDAKGRAGIAENRMQEKLGWVAEYAEEIAVWSECQEVVSRSVTFINEQYLTRGASVALRIAIGELQHAKSREVADRLVNFVGESEQLLRAGERLPMSTEILESAFGLYKQREGQQSKSGFTSMLACLPALLRPATPELVRSAFGRVSAADVKAWSKKHFPSTVTSRRQSAYAEQKSATRRATVRMIAI
jgi:hypothetical protein